MLGRPRMRAESNLRCSCYWHPLKHSGGSYGPQLQSVHAGGIVDHGGGEQGTDINPGNAPGLVGERPGLAPGSLYEPYINPRSEIPLTNHAKFPISRRRIRRLTDTADHWPPRRVAIRRSVNAFAMARRLAPDPTSSAMISRRLLAHWSAFAA